MLYIFDWDGTLCDSLAKIVNCLQRAAARAGEHDLSDHQARQIIGLALPEAIATLFPHRSESDQGLIADLYRAEFIDDQTPAPLFDGALDMLNELRDRGHRLAVATGKSRRGLDEGLRAVGLSDFFCSTRCADETASKPDPLMLLELLGELNFSASEAVMVGDTTFDLLMAKNAGMRRVAVSFGSHSPQQLSDHQPETYLNHLSELLLWPNPNV